MKYIPRLKIKYYNDLIFKLKDKLKYNNIMQVPKIEKICINRGLSSKANNSNLIKISLKEISLITGQKAAISNSKKDISGFNLRANTPIGVYVTLRNNMMYEFLDRLISIVLPRIRDFNGLSPKSFDGNGNYTFGIKEQIIFPEIAIESVKKNMGMDITFVSNKNSDKELYELMKILEFPFKNI